MICIYCGKEVLEIKKKTAKYCSHTCKMSALYHRNNPNATSKLKPKVCAYCGAKFYNKNSIAKYCSPKCKADTRRLESKEYQRNKPKKIRVCYKCGIEFKPSGPNWRYCENCNDIPKIIDEVDNYHDELKNKIFIQPNKVEYYGHHGVLASIKSDIWNEQTNM
jgi:hypothetical protein